MNRLILLSWILLFSCTEKNSINFISDAIQFHSPDTRGINRYDTIPIDLRRSEIRWKGTKLMGLGKHEGEIKIQKGVLVQRNGQWSGGNFTVSMNTLTVTDIPASDPIPLRNLTNHLKGEDFFDVERFPVSHFSITKFEPIEGSFYRVTGILEIKGIQNTVSFAAESRGKTISANFKINRFDWNIAYEGSWADRTLVDRDIEFWVKLVLP
ncbi:YceI family protein [Algoriphagus mannitolivorans]|uniref:YceI family protein n=1 Tax=Algoriphagus mannitolivorans TaxID=226504 RepID=UPI00068659DE|nr:YceI family protein [Algoriphagus mannitolivorans]